MACYAVLNIIFRSNSKLSHKFNQQGDSEACDWLRETSCEAAIGLEGDSSMCLTYLES